MRPPVIGTSATEQGVGAGTAPSEVTVTISKRGATGNLRSMRGFSADPVLSAVRLRSRLPTNQHLANAVRAGMTIGSGSQTMDEPTSAEVALAAVDSLLRVVDQSAHDLREFHDVV